MRGYVIVLKRIKPTQVRLGMFIESIDGEWGRQPFWRSRFLLDNPDDVMTLKESAVKAVIINTDGGADVVTVDARPRRNASSAQVKRALEMIEHSKPMIKTMFDDVRMGNSVPIDTATTVVEHIAECMTDSSRALIAVTRLKSRDEYTFLHSIAVTALMVHFGRSIEIGEQLSQTLAMGGLLHDVGKVKIPLDILNKAGPLSDEEMAQMRQHPQRGYDLLSRQTDMPDAVLDICRDHHERPDGRGYPQGLAGKQISVPVRIASICDVYDALTSKRPYKKAWTPAQAAEFMAAQKGQFDGPLLKRFFCCLSN